MGLIPPFAKQSSRFPGVDGGSRNRSAPVIARSQVAVGKLFRLSEAARISTILVKIGLVRFSSRGSFSRREGSTNNAEMR